MPKHSHTDIFKDILLRKHAILIVSLKIETKHTNAHELNVNFLGEIFALVEFALQFSVLVRKFSENEMPFEYFFHSFIEFILLFHSLSLSVEFSWLEILRVYF